MTMVANVVLTFEFFAAPALKPLSTFVHISAVHGHLRRGYQLFWIDTTACGDRTKW